MSWFGTTAEPVKQEEPVLLPDGTPAPKHHDIYCPLKNGLNDEEQSVVDSLRKNFEKEDVWTLERFARARDFDEVEATLLLQQNIDWRSELSDTGPIEEQLDRWRASKVIYIIPDVLDKFGRPVLYVVPARHNPDARDLEMALRGLVVIMDEVCEAISKTYYQKVCILFNMSGFAMKNNDYSLLKGFLPILQDRYPEVVGRILIANYPWIVYGIWKIVSVWTDAKTRAKVQFVGDAELKEIFEPQCLPLDIGGEWNEPPPTVDLWEEVIQPNDTNE